MNGTDTEEATGFDAETLVENALFAYVTAL